MYDLDVDDDDDDDEKNEKNSTNTLSFILTLTVFEHKRVLHVNSVIFYFFPEQNALNAALI